MNPLSEATSARAPVDVPSPGYVGWRDSIKAGTLIWALSLFMASPPFSTWSQTNIANSRAADYLRLCHDPLTRNLVESMLAYRISTPLLAWLLHLPEVAALALPYFFSLAALVVIHRALVLRSDLGLASLATVGVACSSTFLYTQGCLGIPDSLTHLGSAVAMIGSAPVAAFAILIGGLNDERAALALPFIALWRYPKAVPFNYRTGSTWLALARAIAPLATGLAAALVVRHALTIGLLGDGISTPSLYREIAKTVSELKPWLESWAVWFVNWLKGPGWLWLLLIPPFVSSRWRPAAFPILILGPAFLLVCASTFIVADAARSIGFAFPAALLCCAWIYDRDPQAARKLTMIVASLQVITPALWIYQRWEWLQFRPFPWEFWLFIHTR
ncbi:MAG: hypothetical protein ACAH89_04790 [Rariglobus sp.]